MLKALGGYASTASALGAVIYQGTWDAANNSPTLASNVGTQGEYYVTNVAGNTDLNGITDWNVGDWAIFNGNIWEKVDNTDAVSSVNGKVGTVVLTAGNVDALPDTTRLFAGTGIEVSGNFDDGNATVSLANTAVVAGTYGGANAIPILVIDDQGRITDANSAALTGTVTSVNGQSGVVVLDAANVGAAANTVEIIAGTGLSGGGNLSANVNIALADTLVTPGTYGDASNVSQITIDQQGRVTSASNVAISAPVPDPLNVNDFSAANVSITNSLSANLVSANTATFADPSLPLNPEGYIEVVINGVTKKIPYYGV